MQDQTPSQDQALSPQSFRRSRGEGGRTPGRFSGGIQISGVLGALVGWYAGLALLLPAVLTVIIGFVASKVCSPDRKPLIPPFCIQAAQLGCLVVGFFVLGVNGPQLLNFLDVLWCGVGLVWLMAKPGRAPLYWLAAYQLFALAMNTYVFTQVPIGGPMSKGLAATMLWRVIAMIAMFEVFQGMRKGTIEFAKSS